MVKNGRLAEVIFRNEKNFYTVAVMENDEELEQFVAVGNMPSARIGMLCELTGEWKTHSVYGEQFAFSNCTEMIPQDAEGIRELLSSGLIRGVGPKTADLIVAKFGDKTMDIIAGEPERLREISGIGPKTLQKIVESYQEHMEFVEISVFFSSYGISSANAMKLYARYGPNTIKAVMEDPYRLVREIRGIGFARADEIASRLGFAHDSISRIKSGIGYMLDLYQQNGSTCAPYADFCRQAAQMLEVSSEQVDEAANDMALRDGSLMIVDMDGSQYVYRYRYYLAEREVARRLLNLRDADLKPITLDIEGCILRSEADAGIRLSDNQKKAVRASLENGVTVITGGPGTGKTTIINTMLDVFEQSNLTVEIAAPTGRAAKRISETSGREAVTIHRLLEYTFSEDDEDMHFGRNAGNPLEGDVVILDEMSMVDALLMDALTEAVRPGARLVLVGDADQLPSVGAGRVLGDIIESETIAVVKLTDIFRQASESMIVVNAHRINKGEYPYLNEKDKDFFMLRRNSEQAVLGTIIELCCDRLPKYYSQYDALRDIQVLTPVRKGTLGIHNINEKLQNLLNPHRAGVRERSFGNRILREGDKVMQIKNDYQMKWMRLDTFAEGEGVFNGDIGFITDILPDDRKVRVLFDGNRSAEYEFNNVDELELAYAMTIHKSQGSEFPVVVMPMAAFPPMLSTRNLLYTGVTRGKKGVVLVGSEPMLQRMVDNDTLSARYTGLTGWLQKSFALHAADF